MNDGANHSHNMLSHLERGQDRCPVRAGQRSWPLSFVSSLAPGLITAEDGKRRAHRRPADRVPP